MPRLRLWARAQGAPQTVRLWWKPRQRPLDGFDDRDTIGPCEQLFDVPSVLVAAGIELQQNEVFHPRGRHVTAMMRRGFGPCHDVSVPGPASNDDVHVALAVGAETDDAGEWIRGISDTNIAHDIVGEGVPECRIEHTPVCHQQVEVDGRSTDAVNRQRGSADEGIRHPTSVEYVDNASDEGTRLSRHEPWTAGVRAAGFGRTWLSLPRR